MTWYSASSHTTDVITHLDQWLDAICAVPCSTRSKLPPGFNINAGSPPPSPRHPHRSSSIYPVSRGYHAWTDSIPPAGSLEEHHPYRLSSYRWALSTDDGCARGVRENLGRSLPRYIKNHWGATWLEVFPLARALISVKRFCTLFDYLIVRWTVPIGLYNLRHLIHVWRKHRNIKMGLLQRVVKNDAMKNDPPEIYGWRVFALTFSACFGGMLFGWDIGSIGGIIVCQPLKFFF